ncbi:MAG: ParB/RepB/Spo0J family partition protein [Methyloceanibacter sp.]
MATERRAQLTPEKIGVKSVKTDDLHPNPHNPRLLFDRAPLKVLRDSIAKVGILVPLTVYWAQRQRQYVILDGQRRWMCAQDVGLRDVPVNVVAEPTLIQNIVTMFQIHKLREDWELMPTALKLEVLMNELQERNDRRLAELTGLDEAVVTRCKKLLSYPKTDHDLMLDPDPDKRVKADFFIELYAVRNDREVNKMGWFDREMFTARMLEKYKARRGIKAVTDFRLMKQHLANASKARLKGTISKKLKEFTFDDELDLSHLEISAASARAQASKITVSADKLRTTLEEIRVDEYLGEEKMWVSLRKLSTAIGRKFTEADRRMR